MRPSLPMHVIIIFPGLHPIFGVLPLSPLHFAQIRFWPLKGIGGGGPPNQLNHHTKHKRNKGGEGDGCFLWRPIRRWAARAGSRKQNIRPDHNYWGPTTFPQIGEQHPHPPINMLHHRHPLFFFPVMLLLLHYAAFAFSAPASPFSSSSSEDTPNSILLADMPLLSSSSPFSNERSLLPGVQVFPSSTMGVPGTGQMMPSFQQSAGGFLSQRSLGGGGSLDLESWTKGQAMRANQENAVVAQLAQMAPHRRNQLVRDVANGNTSAANELVARLLRDLAESQHGQMAFPQLQQQQQAAMAMLMDQNGGGGGTFLGANSATGFGPTSALPLPLQLQLLAAQRQQQSMNGIGANRLFLATNGLPNGFATTSNGLLSPIPGLTAQSQFLNERLMRQLLLQQQNRPPLSPFSPSNDFSSDLSRPSPSSPFFNGQQGAAAFTQISPFSQSQQQQSLLSRPRGGVQGGMIGNNAADFGKTLSGAGGGLSSSSSSAFSPSSSSSFNSGGGFFRGMDEPEGISNNNGNGNNMATANSAGRGFVNDLGPEELFGGGGGGGGLVASTGQRKRSGKWGERGDETEGWRKFGEERKKQMRN